nr:uncharacterized protein LOC103330319 [Ipomoea batatas]
MDGKRSRGRAGFLKGKLNWSLYRASATHKLSPASSSSTTKVKPNNIPAGPPAHQLTQLPTQTRSVSYYHPTTDHITNSKPNDDSYIYGGIAVDEEIDRKAANYISSVRERFSLA